MGESGLIIGFNLCNDDCQISYYSGEMTEPVDVTFSEDPVTYHVQNSICKTNGEDDWMIGEEGYETALLGTGTVVDQILRLVAKKGFSSLDGVRYSAEELLYHFLKESFQVVFEKAGTMDVEEVVFTLRELELPIIEAIHQCMKQMGIEKRRVRILSHTEAFLYFALSQPHELLSNVSLLYDLTSAGLNCYEVEILRGRKPNLAVARHEFPEEGFSADILMENSGRRVADSILSSTVSRMISRRLISSVYLSGKGMEEVNEWGTQFLDALCQKRRVFSTNNLFAKGAVYAGLDLLREESAYPYRFLCEGRIATDITADVYLGNKPVRLELCHIGDVRYRSHAEFDFIPDNENSLRLNVQKIGEKEPSVIEIPFKELNSRGNRLTRIHAELQFIRDDEFQIILRDEGFGEFFRSSQKEIVQNFKLS